MSGEGDEIGPRLLQAIEALSTAFRMVDDLGGCSTDFGNPVLLEARTELAHLIRRLTNLAFIHDVPMEATETAKRLNQAA